MAGTQRALIIFPTYNERDNIEKIVHAVLPMDPRINVLIVDDNSPDGTGELADKLAEQEAKVNVLHRERKAGLGKAYIAGFKWAIEQKYDFIFEMDADFSHGPEYLRDFLRDRVALYLRRQRDQLADVPTASILLRQRVYARDHRIAAA
jgi:dolichol-phosphate mannosyltransferase